jgi:hypothetical protein
MELLGYMRHVEPHFGPIGGYVNVVRLEIVLILMLARCTFCT